MGDNTIKDPAATVLAMLEEARLQAARAAANGHAADRDGPATPSGGGDYRDAAFDDDGEPGTSPTDPDSVDAEVVAACAALDHSDTDNARRLLMHFGQDLLVVTQAKARSPFFAVWAGTHWDTDNGGPRALAIAQKLGGRIALEAALIAPTEREERAMKAGKDALEKDEEERSPPEKKKAAAAAKAEEAWRKRVKRRMDHAVSSKNVARLNAMLACLAPHVMRAPDDFNADPMTFATLGHTISFAKVVERVVPSADDADDSREDYEVTRGRKSVRQGHSRADLITQLVPVDYDPQATCPKWTGFMEDMLPATPVRRMVQVASGLGLLGISVQRLFFHYGSGANGKSVYMETICRLLGSASVTLPATSFIGESNTGGAASPDIARLYGRRHLRVKELPQGEDLKENLVKEITGGEELTARDLHQGYFDFKPLFTAHMSGNGYPRITGLDNGIWRRMAVVEWPKQIAEADQRDFEEVLADFTPEYAGILNWLIEGVMIYLAEGLVIPDEVRKATQDYRDEMDRTAAFCARCVVADPTSSITAKEFYQAYVDFTIDEGGKPISLTAFGLIMKRKYVRVDGRVNTYKGIRLVDVPQRPHGGQDDFEGHLR